MKYKKQYEELCRVINFADGANFKKDKIKRDIKRIFRRLNRDPNWNGVLDYNLFPPDFRYNLCSARLSLRDFSNWDGWMFRSDFSTTFMEGSRLNCPIWDGSKVDHLVILGEQGIGDEILYGSAIPEVIVRLGHEAIEFQCMPRLKSIFERSFKIKCTDRKFFKDINKGHLVMLSDLMMFYRKDKKHFPKKPFLKPDPKLVKMYLENLKRYPRPWTGIAWKSRHGNISPKIQSEGTTFNLQYGQASCDAVSIVDALEDMESHLALVSVMDQVISVTQTLVHEAGSLGIPTIAIKPRKGTGESDSLLWYYGHGGPHIVYGNVEVMTEKEYDRK